MVRAAFLITLILGKLFSHQSLKSTATHVAQREAATDISKGDRPNTTPAGCLMYLTLFRLQAVPFWSVERVRSQRSETGARRNKREETGFFALGYFA